MVLLLDDEGTGCGPAYAETLAARESTQRPHGVIADHYARLGGGGFACYERRRVSVVTIGSAAKGRAAPAAIVDSHGSAAAANPSCFCGPRA